LPRDVDLAKDKFYTMKNGQIDAVGVDYRQLYQWSWDVRYEPRESLLPTNPDLSIAIKYLKNIRRVAQNEIGYYFKYDNGQAVKISI
jgi:hypothetical protein